MLRKSRLYFSAILAALVMVSLLTTSNVKACEEEPQTFLSLYMNSDLVVFAKYDSESEAKKTNEDEYGYSLETERKLALTKIFKGNKDLKSISFAYSQYVSNPNPNPNPDAEQEEIPEYDHFDVSKIKIGGEYLFFLTANKETGEYSVTDYMSGVRELDKKLSFYEKNLSEIEQIASAKENQYELLTEWLVKSVENPESREDALGDLAESFYGLNYQDEDPAYKGKGPFVVNEEGYGIYTVGVAKHLTAGQKERISAVLYPMLQEAWFAETPEYANYSISAILGGINKSSLAVYAYNSMRSVGKSDAERRRVIGDFLYEMSGDEVFSNLNNEVIELETKIGEAKSVKTPQGRKQLKDLNVLRNAKLKELDTRFNLLLDRNFVPVENKEV